MLGRLAVRSGLTTCVCIAAVAGLTACSGSSGFTAASGAATSSASAPASAPTSVATPTSTGASPRAGASSPAPTPATVTASPSVAVATQPPVKIGASAALVSRVTVSVGTVRTATITAAGPGEIAGPALVVPVTVRNATTRAFDLGGVVVNALYSGGTPAIPSDAAPSRPLPETLPAGAAATGLYVFRAAPGAGTSLRVEVSSDNARNVLVFRR